MHEEAWPAGAVHEHISIIRDVHRAPRGQVQCSGSHVLKADCRELRACSQIQGSHFCFIVFSVVLPIVPILVSVLNGKRFQALELPNSRAEILVELLLSLKRQHQMLELAHGWQ